MKKKIIIIQQSQIFLSKWDEKMSEFTLNLLCNDYRVLKSQCRTAKYIYLIYTWLTCVLYAFQTTSSGLSQMHFGEYLHLVTIPKISWRFLCEFNQLFQLFHLLFLLYLYLSWGILGETSEIKLTLK